jgi:hypothetical protein
MLASDAFNTVTCVASECLCWDASRLALRASARCLRVANRDVLYIGYPFFVV